MIKRRFTTKKYITRNDPIKLVAKAIKDADVILIGAGSGLSFSAGFEFSGERFKKYFSKYEEKYGFHDMYSGGFYKFPTPEEHWAFWSKKILINRFEDEKRPVYENLYEIVKDKNYFVITSNIDHLFQRYGFDVKRLYVPQGDFGYFQCSIPCHQKIYDNEKLIEKMVESTVDMKIPTELLPRCPKCNSLMRLNTGSYSDGYVKTSIYSTDEEEYKMFLEENKDSKIVYLELGIGDNTPGLIKYPFWRFTRKNEKSTYICINRDEARVPENISDRSLCVSMDLGDAISEILDSIR